jgi:hypothetical protein
MKIRKSHTFRRPLTPPEAALLMLHLGWRRGSTIRQDDAGQVVGCVAHPDDVASFVKAVGEKLVRGKAQSRTRSADRPRLPAWEHRNGPQRKSAT